jgi:hypothetical protein
MLGQVAGIVIGVLAAIALGFLGPFIFSGFLNLKKKKKCNLI